MATLDWRRLLEVAVDHKASDIHVIAGIPPLLRVNTALVAAEGFPAPSAEQTEQIAREMAGEQRFGELLVNKAADFSTQLDDRARFRVNAHIQRNSVAMAFRLIPDRVPELDDLNLPPIVKRLAEVPNGLILVTGQSGDGKTTTLASILDHINRSQAVHVITLEDPIEYLFRNDKATIEQREVGRDVPSFARGLRDALRQDPDVIMVGEMRDMETAASAITAAETGHLVLSTLHTCGAPQSIERIVDIFPADQQEMVRTILANILQAVISQVLFKRLDQPGAIPACEVMLCTPAVRSCIRRGDLQQIPNLLQTGRKEGMCPIEDGVAALCAAGRISKEQAESYAFKLHTLNKALCA